MRRKIIGPIRGYHQQDSGDVDQECLWLGRQRIQGARDLKKSQQQGQALSLAHPARGQEGTEVGVHQILYAHSE